MVEERRRALIVMLEEGALPWSVVVLEDSSLTWRVVVEIRTFTSVEYSSGEQNTRVKCRGAEEDSVQNKTEE